MKTTADLVHAIEQTRPLSPAIRNALLAVDRAIFVPRSYRHQGAEWILQETGLTAYEDTALTTQVTNNMPSSSSSGPGLMAAMLEALSVQPGHRVLEIGTGTGYNAALLALLVGDEGMVYSVDIDDALVSQAKEHLREAGVKNTRVLTYDGLQGYAMAAPYHRLIVTGGFRAIPAVWLEQLAEDGVLVGNLLGKIVPILLRVQKVQGTITGSLVAYPAFFMELHPKEEYPTIQAPDWTIYDAFPAQKIHLDPRLREALSDPAFLFFLQGHSPELELHIRAQGTPEHFETSRTFIKPATHASVQVWANGTGEARGTIWEEILAHWEHYGEMESPTVEKYTLRLEQGRLVAHNGTQNWDVCQVEKR